MLNLQELTRQTIGLAATEIAKTQNDPSLRKAINVATGLVGFNLQVPAQQLVPLMSPFRQSIPRILKPGANSDNWRQITSLSFSKASTVENAAGNAFSTVLVSKTGAYKVVPAMVGQVTLEAQRASQGFDDALAKETANTLLLSMKLESQYMLGGNITALATPGTPTATAIASVAALSGTGKDTAWTAAAHFFRIAALTLPAANRYSIQRPTAYDGTNALLAPVGVEGTSSTANGLATLPAPVQGVSAGSPGSDGVTVGSAASGTATPAATGGVKLTWTPVPGAAAYAIFAGLADDTTMVAQCIVTQCNVTLTSKVTSATAPNTTVLSALTGSSADAASYDGIIPQLFAAGSGSYIKQLGAKLSQAGGELVELQDAFTSLFDSVKLGKFRVVVSGQEARTLGALGITSGSLRIVVSPQDVTRSSVTIGQHIGNVINGVTGDICPIETDPWLPGGTLLILPTEIPYPMANISAPFQWVGSYDYERWEYASTTSTGPVYPFEVRANGILEGLFTGGCGVISNILRG